MDRLRRKLRSKKATSEERPENKDDNGENKGTPSPSERTHTVASKEENNGRACRECDFVAKTPTALKIHCRRKHNSSKSEGATGAAEKVAEEKSSTDEPKSATPPTGEFSTDSPHIDQLSSGVTTINSPSSAAPPIDHISSGVAPSDTLSSPAPPIDYHSFGVASIDLISSAAAPIDHHSSSVTPIDPLSSVAAPNEQLSTETPPVEQLSSGILGIPAIDQLDSGTQRFERLYCRCCSFYTCTVEEMNAHLSDESHLNLTAEKKIGPLFEQCVEKVLVILSDEPKSADVQREHDEGVSECATEDAEEMEPAERASSEVADASDSHKRKRGRPKSSQVISCSHCGLVASNPTNLSVHIRRKHSRLYGFHCKLCDYSCVTKGDMDRHCETKKHIKRVQSDGDGQEAVITLNPEQTAQSGEKTPNAPDAETQETSNVEQKGEAEETGSDPPCKKTKYDSVYSCNHCYFVAHSALSLALHVRRKHTRDFEFVCLACSYYAVTRREMSRHTATEKHKFKRQRYLNKTHQPDADKLGENASRQAESGNLSDGADKENAQQNPDKAHQHNKHSNTDTERASGVNDAKNDEGKGSGGEEELNRTPQLKSGEDTNSSKDSEFADPSNAEEGDEEYNNDDEEDEEQEEEEDMCETDGESPSSEGRMCRATAFDECVFSLKRPAGEPHDKDEGEPYISLQQAAKMLKMLEGQEVSTRVRCGDCGFLAEGLSGLNVHIMMKHSSKEKPFHCLLCGKSFHSDSSLQQHLSSSAHVRTERGSVDERPDGGTIFRCVRCNEHCSSEQELFFHIKEKHEELLREVNKYVMEDTEQINREREENPGNVCKYCGKVCKSSNSMAFLAHVRTHTGSKPFMCKICNFATAQLGDARNHVKRHLGMREYKCHLCGWAFVMKKHLNTHLLGKHGLGQPKERKYDCELCERSFSEKWALNNHMKLHTGDKPFKCPWSSCHYAFLTHSAMKDHYRTHTGEKSFLCDLCGFAGGTRHALTKHRRQHTGERPFRCDLCSFASTTQSHLTRHKRVHTGEKPYRCPWCDYRSNCAENIRKHILHTGKHEGVMMYNCPRCDFCTNSPSEFRNHLKDKHIDIENPDLAYLHAGIVSKSFECRLKGQGSTYVEADAPYMPDEGRLGAETLQQVIIIQGYGEEAELQGTEMEEAELEESAAATLQTLAMSSVNGELLQVTQDGSIIPYTHKNYVLVESSGSGAEQTLQMAEKVSHEANPDGTAPSTALDALLCAVSEIDQQDGATQQDIRTTQQQIQAQGEGQEAVQVYGEVVRVLGHAPDEVLQFAASQLMMREGLTQVIVNDEGTHYIVTEVAEGDVYTQSEGVVSGQEVGLVDDSGNQTGEAQVTYDPVSLKQDAQE